MNHLRNIILVTILLLLPVFLSGCWDRKEINDVAIVLTSAIDIEEDGTYRVTVLIPLARQLAGSTKGGSSDGKAYYLDSESAPTITEATFKLQKKMARHMSLTHRRIIVIGEQLAREGIDFIFDHIPRWYENRLSTLLVISEGTGADFLQASPKLERFPSEASRELVRAMDVFSVDIRQVGIQLSYDSDPIIPFLLKKQTTIGNDTSEEVSVGGYAQFHKGKMVDVFRDDEAHGLLWLLKKPRSYEMSFSDDTHKLLSFYVQSGHIQITPSSQSGQLSFHVLVNVHAKLREDSSTDDEFHTQRIYDLEQQLADGINRQITAAIQQMQQKGTDSVQLGLAVWRKFPADWKQHYESTWNEIFPKTIITVHVDARILDTGLIDQDITKESP